MDGHRILIATHDEELSGKLAHMLVRRYEVIQSADGEEVMGLLESADPDFIVVDGELPKVDGFMICKTARRKPSYEKTPIFLFSARATREDFNKGYEAGATLYMAKPVDLMRLARQVDFTIQRDQIKIKVKHFSAEVLRHQGVKAQPKGGLKSMTRSQARPITKASDVTPAPPAPPPEPGAGLKQVLASITGTARTSPPITRFDEPAPNGTHNGTPAVAPPPPPAPAPPAPMAASAPPPRPWEDPAFADLDLDLDVPHTAPAQPPPAPPAAAMPPPVVAAELHAAPQPQQPPPALTTAPSNPNVKEEIARLIGARLNLGSTPTTPTQEPAPETKPVTPIGDAGNPRRIVFTDLIGANPTITPHPHGTPQPPVTPKPAEVQPPRPKSRLNLSELIANIPQKTVQAVSAEIAEETTERQAVGSEAPENETQTKSVPLGSLLDKILH